MHVATIKRRHGDREYVSHLLRHSYREDGKVRHKTLGNLSHLPPEVVELVREALRGGGAGPGSPEGPDAAGGGGEPGGQGGRGQIEVTRSLPHGHLAALVGLADRLGLVEMLGPACRERDLALAMICSRVMRPDSKAACARYWRHTSLGEDLGIQSAGPDECYRAMDWLVARQDQIEAQLAARHLGEGELVYYDLSGSYLEGRRCPLAARGYSRDGKQGKLQITYGLVCDPEGRPVAIKAHPGNTADPATLGVAVSALRERCGLSRVVVVGDRGMITSARVRALRDLGGVDWITALRGPEIKALAAGGQLQLSLLDEADLAEVSSPDYPGERLVVCLNRALRSERARKRLELLEATEADLERLVARVKAGRLKDPGKIGLAAGRVVDRFKMRKHFDLEIGPGQFAYRRKAEQVSAEAALDGLYVIRSSVAGERLGAGELVGAYKGLARVERAFRSIKSVDLEIRPVHHHLEGRVRAHLLICMLAYYLTWHLRRAWAPLTFTDQAPPERTDPVAKAARSAAATRKASTGRTTDGLAAHSFGEIIDILGTLTRNTLRLPGAGQIEVLATPNDIQRRAFELLELPIPMRLVARS